jgi:hypothetical protein
VCHEFGGRDVNVHHVVQEAYGGANTIENAICLCLRCHSEAGHYNSRHPLGTKYSPTELLAHRDQWWQHCLTHPEEPQGPSLDVGFKSVSITSEVHRYRLLVTYTNTLKDAQDGWKLKICFPAFLPLTLGDYDRSEIRINGEPYVQLESSSRDRIFPGETVAIVAQDIQCIEYEVNNTVYRRLHDAHKVVWQFFTPNAPVIAGERALVELHKY